MNIPLAMGAYRRLAGRFPEVVQTNYVAEKAPTQLDRPVALIGRPGVTSFTTVGTAPLRGVGRKVGLFNGQAIILANDTVHRVSETGVVVAFSGTVSGSDRVRIVIGRNGADEELARIATGDALYSVDSTGASLENFPAPGGSGATDVEEHLYHWFAIEAGTDTVWFQVPGSTTWNGLDFASAEYLPDKAVAVRSFNQLLGVLGENSFELWALTGEGAAPVAPVGGMRFRIGCRSRDAAVVLADARGDALVWVDDRSSVRISRGDVPDTISDPGLAELIRGVTSEELRAWGFSVDQHVYYILRVGDVATAVYDLSTGLWARFTSAGYAYWRAHLGCDFGGFALAMDSVGTSNQIYKLDPDALTDDGDPIPTECTGYFPLTEGSADVHCITVNASVGYVDVSETNPLMSLALCRDGQIYQAPRYLNLPLTGEYPIVPKFRRCGQARAPHGLWFRVAQSDMMVKRISGFTAEVTIYDPSGRRV